MSTQNRIKVLFNIILQSRANLQAKRSAKISVIKGRMVPQV